MNYCSRGGGLERLTTWAAVGQCRLAASCTCQPHSVHAQSVSLYVETGCDLVRRRNCTGPTVSCGARPAGEPSTVWKRLFTIFTSIGEKKQCHPNRSIQLLKAPPCRAVRETSRIGR